MAAPDVYVNVLDLRAPAHAPIDTGVAYLVGFTDRGPASPIRTDGTAIELRTIHDFEKTYGLRQSYSPLHDCVRAFFLESEGGKCYVSRVIGPAAATATVNVPDAQGTPVTSLVVTADSPGSWGNNFQVAVTAGQGGGTYVLSIYDNTTSPATLAEQSYDLTTQQDAVDWARRNSNYVVVTVGASSQQPKVTTSNLSLAAGADDRLNATDTQWEAAIDRFEKSMGPGQIMAPGRTTDAIHAYLLAHANTNNRFAPLDSSATAARASVVAAGQAVKGAPLGRRGSVYAPWVEFPGPTAGSTVDIPGSVVAAALMSKRDRKEGPNQPAAGELGESRYATGLTVKFTDDDRDLLNQNGVTVIKPVYGRYRVYGNRTLTDPVNDENWLQVGNSREIMYLVARCEEIGQRYMFKQITRAGTLHHLETDLTNLCKEEWNKGALFSTQDAPDDPLSSYFVDATSIAVNPDSELEKGNVKARVEVRLSPAAEMVTIELVKAALTSSF